MHARRSRRREVGFTLIELTVVILVILILMGLALPRFGQITDAAKRADCVANIRNMEMAIAQWETKNSGAYPQTWIDKNGRSYGRAAYDLSAYTRDTSAFDCPVYSRSRGEYVYIRPENDQRYRYRAWFPGVNCYGYGRPPHLSLDNPHTVYTSDPY